MRYRLRLGGVVVALGHNLRVQSGDPTAHAETVCIRNAGRRRDWHTLTLASTLPYRYRETDHLERHTTHG